MKIYYSPAFTSNAYFDLGPDAVAFDISVCGNAELLRTLMLHLGIHHDLLSQVERQAEYYNIFVKCDEEKPNNVFHKSFSVGGLAVSSKCLEWRDKLILAGWTSEMNQKSERLQFLAEVEKDFHCIGEADCWIEVLRAMDDRCALPQGSEVVLSNISRKVLPPYLADIFTKLEKSGIQVTENITSSACAKGNLGIIQKYLLGQDTAKDFSPTDKSFEILQFPDEMTALQYVASLNSDAYDVYINSDNKTFDDIQLALNHPTSGSSITNANPQIVQLFTLGLSLFDYPINIYNVLSWLLAPMSPIHSPLRKKLARTISGSGGIKNKEWNDAIADYKENDVYDYKDDGKELRSPEDKQSDIDALSTLLPLQGGKEIQTSELKTFVNSISDYAKKMSHANDSKPILSTSAIEQFNRLVSMFNALSLILDKYTPDVLTYADLEKWTSAIYESATYTYTEAQTSSRFVVSSPGDISTSANNILWMDFYNYTIPKSTYDFLSQSEKKYLLDQQCHLPDTASETSLANSYYKLPFLYGRSRLTLITVDRKDGAPTTKHPMLIRLEQDFKDSLPAVTSAGKLSDNCYEKKDIFTNAGDGLSVTITNNNLLSFRDHESYSSLTNLIQYPFDYVMQYLANFRENNTYQLDEIDTIKGNVAHAMVERLCKDNDRDLVKIQADFDNHFDAILEELILAKGAILLLTENKTEKMLFTHQLKEAVRILLEIIRDNHLIITGNEVGLEEQLSFYKDISAQGNIDMILADANGSPVLFDFKWSSSKKYEKSLRENTSLQLALYEQLIAKDQDRHVAAKAYFLFPSHTLLTTSKDIKGSHVHPVDPSDAADLLPKILASYKYRRQQIEDDGFIELAEGTPAADISYYQEQQKERLLFPLEIYDNSNPRITLKGTNFYSNYTLLKGTKK
jgi:hypothetical protein